MAIIVTCRNTGCNNDTFAAVEDSHDAQCSSCLEQQRQKDEKKEEERWQALTLEQKLNDLHQRLREQENARRQNPHFPPMDG